MVLIRRKRWWLATLAIRPGSETLGWIKGEVAVGVVVMVLRSRFRQHWKSWLALSVLVAVAGGFVLATAATGRRTAAAFGDFVARHGYDTVVYSGQPLPLLARLPQVASVTPVAAQGRVSGWSGSQGAGGSLGAGRYRPRAERGG